MKRLLLLTIALVGFTFYSHAQSPIGVGAKQLNAGFGFSNWGVPVYAGLDFGVHPDITIGPQVSFRSHSETYYDGTRNRKWNHNLFTIGFNGNYHFDRLLELPSEWNVYAGLTLGYFIWSSPSEYTGTRSSTLNLYAQVGGRYYFSDRFGVCLEFGGGYVSGGRFGISYKF